MSSEERDRLLQLVKDRNKMIIEMEHVKDTYVNWGRLGLGDSYFEHRPFYVPTIPLSPFAWSDILRRTEEKRVNRWKLQRKNMQQVMLLLEASVEAVSMPEDAFDELESDG